MHVVAARACGATSSVKLASGTAAYVLQVIAKCRLLTQLYVCVHCQLHLKPTNQIAAVYAISCHNQQCNMRCHTKFQVTT